ncbi:MAG: fibronectin type III domain-containing protein [Bacteroidales bacterium]|nr:fibronectin type III domain-containing protein [Candidatus Liminaster caballi]
MKKLFTKLLLLVAMVAMCGNAWADSVTITLKDCNGDSDSSSKIANANATIDAQMYSVSTNNFVNTIVAGNAYVFQAKTDCGWKFGNSSNAGKITINLANAVEVASVKVTAKNASSKVADLKIAGGSAQALTSVFADYTQAYPSGNSTNSIIIETALHTSGDRRAYITSIVITTADNGGGNTPSTPTALSVPSNLSSSNVTTTGATLSWNAVSNASSYTVKIGETEYTGVNTNSYSATGLTAGTQYTWTVKAVGDGINYSTSAYAANANFTTEADQGGGAGNTITIWSEDFSKVAFSGTSVTQTDLSKITSATFVQRVKGNTDATIYKNDNNAGGTAPEFFISKRAGSGSSITATEIDITVNLDGCFGDLTLTFKSTIANGATAVFVKTEDAGVTYRQGDNAKEWIFTVPEGKSTLTFTIVNNSSSNQRFDDFLLTGTQKSISSSENLQGYKTYFNAETNMEVDANTTIYKVSSTSDDAVTLSSVSADKIIPAGTPVILKASTTSNYKITLTTTETVSSNDFDGNQLRVADGGETSKWILAYTTARGLGFYNYTSALDAGDIYVEAPSNSASTMRIVIEDGEEGNQTAIENINANNNNVVKYDLQGRRTNAKGLLIENGKVVLVK